MAETLQDDPSVHQRGLQVRPAASPKTSGAPTDVRGSDNFNGLKEAGPADGKVLESLGRFGENTPTTQEGLGQIALNGSGIETSPQSSMDNGTENADADQPGLNSEKLDALAERAQSLLKGTSPRHFGQDIQRLSASLGETQQAGTKEVKSQTNPLISTEIPPIQTPENPAVMQSVFELANNPKVDIDTRILAIKAYIKKQEAKEDQGPPGETFEEYKARLGRITSGQERGWSPELKYAKEVLLALKALRRPEDQGADHVTHEANDTQPPITTNEPKLAPEEKSTQEPEHEDASYSGTEVVDYEEPETYEEAVEKITQKKQQEPPVPQPVPQQVPNLSLESDQIGKLNSLGTLAPTKTGESTTSTQPNETQRDLVDTLKAGDKNLWDEIVRIDTQQNDGEVSEGLRRLKDSFTSEGARKVVSIAEARATERSEGGDVPGAKQLKRLARDVRKLNEHVSGVTIPEAA